MLVDIAKIKVTAGNGGDGHVSFRREKNIPKGGPDGGNGGNGGNVYIVADHNLATLMDFRAKNHYKAQKGMEGGKKKMTGVSGEDLFIKVPAGTLIYELRGEEKILIGDLIEDGQKLLVAQGGLGGRGNTRFKSSTNQTPKQFTRGTKGAYKELGLEIKLIADVGLIGMPNAGKSTLINQLTSSKAEVGEYPFTTLFPNLGICRSSDSQEVIVADIPGLIEGASQGKGLGDEFLRHVERTRMLVHIIDPGLGDDVAERTLKRYKAIRQELEEYSDNLLEKKEIVVINKMDLVEVRDHFAEIKKVFKKEKVEVLGMSAITGEGIDQLKTVMFDVLQKIPPTPPFESKKPVKLYTLENLPNRRMVFRGDRVEEKCYNT